MAKEPKTFWQRWKCPKCGRMNSTERRVSSIGKTVWSYCSAMHGVKGVLVEKKTDGSYASLGCEE